MTFSGIRPWRVHAPVHRAPLIARGRSAPRHSCPPQGDSTGLRHGSPARREGSCCPGGALAPLAPSGRRRIYSRPRSKGLNQRVDPPKVSLTGTQQTALVTLYGKALNSCQSEKQIRPWASTMT